MRRLAHVSGLGTWLRLPAFLGFAELNATPLPLGCFALSLPILLCGFPLVLRGSLLIFPGSVLGPLRTICASVNLRLGRS